MRIQYITPYNYSNKYQKNNQYVINQNNISEKTSSDISKNNISFTGILGKDLLIKYLQFNPINTFKEFSKDEYFRLSQAQINRLRGEYNILELTEPLYYGSIAKMHDFASDCLKTVFDSRFGKNNYVVVPIGRSVSSVGKVLGLKIGEENVVNIPMSNAGRFFGEDPITWRYAKFVEKVKKEDGFGKFLKYLESVHLTKRDIENSGKNYILIDYCSTGDSLKGAERLFKSDLVWGNRKRNIFAVDFINAISGLRAKNSILLGVDNNDCNEKRIVNAFSQYLLTSRFKNLSLVGKSRYFKDTQDALPSEMIKNIDKKSKLVWFHLLDTVLSKDKVDIPNLKIIPREDKLFSQRFKNQHVESWHDSISQYQSDLREDLDDINKIFLKYDNSIVNVDNKENIQKAYQDINGVYHYLLGTYSHIQNPQYRYNFYEIRSDVHKMIDELNLLLDK